MAKSSRDKGKRGEREVAEVFTAAGLPADRTAALQAGSVPGAGDVTVRDLPELHIESKRQETYDLGAWERQADVAALSHQTPVIAYRKSRQPWRASVPLDWLAGILAELVRLRREVQA
jgi:Holliday junction resolvase